MLFEKNRPNEILKMKSLPYFFNKLKEGRSGEGRLADKEFIDDAS
jgi:hypothetical protein